MSVNEVDRGVVLAARPESARTARTQVRTWLESASWPEALGDDIVYAVNEAVTNSVEHAYRPPSAGRTIALEFRVEDGGDGSRRVRVRVSDQGQWRSPPADSGWRGHGLALMRATMDEVVVAAGGGIGGGTEVMMLSPPTAADQRPGGSGRESNPPDRDTRPHRF